MLSFVRRILFGTGFSLLVSLQVASVAFAATPNANYPEPVVQWVVEKDESCASIAAALYGNAQHQSLINRYNRVDCSSRALPEGLTLILPQSVTSLPDARIRSMSPAVQTRAAGGSWAPAGSGIPLFRGHNVNTLETGRADIEFVDRTRVFLAENTLVVIYGTASNTVVRKNQPQTIELDQGEVNAGLAALRGDSVQVSVSGGGSVSASSKSTVVQRRGQRTTVAVFDGHASVKNAGQSVEVPENHGTRFTGSQPPSPPRPLPPAPAWAEHSFDSLALAPNGEALLSGAWKAVANAKAYRVEIARDRDFHDLLAKEEVPSNILSFRAEKIPPGQYFVSVRAIDTDDYLGIPSSIRSVTVVPFSALSGFGALAQDGLEVSPYTVLSLAGSPSDLEAAIDNQPFASKISTIDLGQTHASQLRFRLRGADESTVVALKYKELTASLSSSHAAGTCTLVAQIPGYTAEQIRAWIRPRFVVHADGGLPAFIAPAVLDQAISTTIALSSDATARIDLVDKYDRPLASTVVGESAPAKTVTPPSEIPAPPADIGPLLAPISLGANANPALYSPTAPKAAGIGLSLGRQDNQNQAQGYLRASGNFGSVSLNGAIATQALQATKTDASSWFGLQFRTFRLGASQFEHAFSARLSVPMSGNGQSLRWEPSMALGGVNGKSSWLANLGLRQRIKDAQGDAAPVPPLQGFLVLGVTYAPLRALSLFEIVDLGWASRDAASSQVPMGSTSGIQVGGRFFASSSIRIAAIRADEPPVSCHVALGFREW